VADAQHQAPAAGEGDQVLHDGAEAGDGAGAQVVAVAEAPGQDGHVRAAQLVPAVPTERRLAAHELDRLVDVVVAVGAREGDDGDPHAPFPPAPAAEAAPSARRTSKSSVTGLAKRRRHMARAVSSASVSSLASRARRMSFPTR